jgi:8-oxo-dGTP diphosphatase
VKRPQPERAATAPVLVAAAVVWRDERVLLTQRPPGGALALLWEFPGGKIEQGETPEHALVREIEEELGVRATPGAVLGVHRHAYPHGPEVEIFFVECALESFAFRSSGAVHAVRWARPQDVDHDQVLPGDREFLTALAAGRKDGARPGRGG